MALQLKKIPAWGLLLLCIFVLIFVTFLPFLLGEINKAPGTLHIPSTDPEGEDYFVFLSYIEQARQGNFLLQNLYTTETQVPAQLNPVWLLAGNLARFGAISNVAAYYLTTGIGVALAVVAVYLFISVFLGAHRRARWLGLFLAIGGGGAGFIQYLIYPSILSAPLGLISIDLLSRDNFPLTAFLMGPHHSFSLALLFFAAYFIVTAAPRNYRLWWGGACTGVLALFHPYPAILLLVIFLLYQLILCFSRQSWRATIINSLKFSALGIVSLLYQCFIFFKIPALTGWLWQNNLPAPSALSFFLGYLWLLPGIALLLIFLWRAKRDEKLSFPNLSFSSRPGLFLWTWIIAGPIIVYSPLPFQSKLIEGYQVLAGTAAAAGFVLLWHYWRRHPWSIKKKVATIGLVCLCLAAFLGTNFFIIKEFSSFHWNAVDFPITIDGPAQDAYRWFGQNSPPSAVILSAHVSGLVIPALSGRLVYFGHGHQTARFNEKSSAVSGFFRDSSDGEQKQHWLDEQGIDYVFFSPEEAKLGTFDPASAPWLTKVFENSYAQIFQVVR